MTTLDIFIKSCPECAATLPIDTRKCECGYSYQSDKNDDGRPSENLVAKAEALYEYFLTARAVQSLREIKLAKIEMALDPDDPDKAARVKQAEREAQTLQARLAAQTYKTAEARKMAQKSKTAKAINAEPVFTEPPEDLRDKFAFLGDLSMHNLETVAITDAFDKADPGDPANESGTEKAERIVRALEQRTHDAPDAGNMDFITEEEFAELRGMASANKNL